MQPPEGTTPSQPDAPMPPPPSGEPGAAQPGYGMSPGLTGPGLSSGVPRAQRTGTTRPLAGYLVVGGGLAVVIGVFLPWLQASTASVSYSENGLKIGTYGTLLLGGFAVARGASMVRPNMFRMGLGTPIIGGVLIAVLMAARWSTLTQVIADYNAQPGVTASIGVGVWMVIAGAACIIIGGLMSGRPGRL